MHANESILVLLTSKIHGTPILRGQTCTLKTQVIGVSVKGCQQHWIVTRELKFGRKIVDRAI